MQNAQSSEQSRRRSAKGGNGEGGLYQRPSDGRWCASVSLDYGRRKVIYGKSRKEVATKLNGALQRKQHGIQFGPETLTVGEWLEHWLEQVVKTEREPATHEAAKSASGATSSLDSGGPSS